MAHKKTSLSKDFFKEFMEFGNWYFVKEVFFLDFYSIVKLLGAGNLFYQDDI